MQLVLLVLVAILVPQATIEIPVVKAVQVTPVVKVTIATIAVPVTPAPPIVLGGVPP